MKTAALVAAIDTAFCTPDAEARRFCNPGESIWTWDFSKTTGNEDHVLHHVFRGRPATAAEARAVVFQHLDTVLLVAGWLKDHIA